MTKWRDAVLLLLDSIDVDDAEKITVAAERIIQYARYVPLDDSDKEIFRRATSAIRVAIYFAKDREGK